MEGRRQVGSAGKVVQSVQPFLRVTPPKAAHDAVVIALARLEVRCGIEKSEAEHAPPGGIDGERQSIRPRPQLNEWVRHLLALKQGCQDGRMLRRFASHLVQQLRDVLELRLIDRLARQQPRLGQR